MRTVVLTFDNLGAAAEVDRGEWPADRPAVDHPSVAVALPRLLDALGGLGLTATFFVEAVNAVELPDAVRAIAAGGHEVGMHAWRHERWDELPPARADELLARGLAAFAELGVPVTGFRPPGGGLGEGGLARLAAAGLRWCSPEGERFHRAPEGVVVLPFRWELVDATYLYAPFGDLRTARGLPASPLAPAAAGERLRAGLAAGGDDADAVLILHPFLAVDATVWAMHLELLEALAAARDAGGLRVAPGAIAAAALAG